MKKPTLVIVGRPNVGKSALFNRLYGKKRALVHDFEGVTRDRLMEEAEWWVRGKQLSLQLVDTGGLGGDHLAEAISKEIRNQVDVALSEASVVVQVVDYQAGVLPVDIEVNRRLLPIQNKNIKLILAVNKCDHFSHDDLTDFYRLSADQMIPISAEHGLGIEELKETIYDILMPEGEIKGELEEIPEVLPEILPEALNDDIPETNHFIKIAVVGKPNVGKSTLINAILGEERMIVSPIAGTTVDFVDSQAKLDGEDILLIDTAGIRRKSKTEKGVEVLSVVQTKKALERCDVALLVMDGELGVADQDEKIGGMIEDVGCGVVLVLNKWDTQRGKDFSQKEAAELVREKVPFLKYAPIVFTSAKYGRGIEGLGELCREIINQRRVKLSTPELTKWVRAAIPVHNPKNAKFYLAHQTSRNPPTVVCHVSDPKKIHFSLERNLLNGIRKKWGFMGSPLRILFKKAGNNKR